MPFFLYGSGILWVLFLFFIVIAFVFLFVRMFWWSQRRRRWEERAARRSMAGTGQGGMGGGRAMMIARQRYARGEITREQYDEIATTLNRRRGPE